MPIEADATVRALDELAAGILKATEATVGEAAHRVQAVARTYAPHLRGTLAESIVVDGPRQASLVTGLPKGLAYDASAFAAQVGPTTVYGRIRELGGPIPGRRTVMAHPYLRWWWGGHYVFKHSVRQRGTHYLRRAEATVVPEYRAMFAGEVAIVIRSV